MRAEGVDAIMMVLLTHVNANIASSKKNNLPMKKFTREEFKQVLEEADLLPKKKPHPVIETDSDDEIPVPSPHPPNKYPVTQKWNGHNSEDDDLENIQSRLSKTFRDDRHVK